MPVVPSSSGPTVAPGQTPQIRTSLEDFGGGQAARLPDLSGIAGTVEKIRQDAKFKADQIAVVDAGSKVSALETNLLYDPTNGVLNQRGRNAMAAAGTVSESWQKGVSDIQGSLTNDEQRIQFGRMAEAHWASINEQTQRHVANETRTVDQESVAAYLTNEQNAGISAGLSDPKRVDAAIGNQSAAIRDFADRNGWSAEQTAEHVAQATSKTRFGVLERLVNTEQDQAATTYFSQHRADFAGRDLQEAERLTDASSVRGESQRQADDITTKATSLGDALQSVASIQDPKVRDATEQRVRRVYADRASDDRQQKAEAFQRASATIEQTGDFDKVPMMDRLKLTPEENAGLQHRADQIAHPKTITNKDVYTSLLNGAGLNPTTRAHFEALDLSQYKDQLSDKDYSALLSKQLTMRLGTQARDAADSRHEQYAGEAEARHDKYSAETEARRQQHAADAQAKKVADAAAKRAAAMKTLQDMGIHVGPAVPGAPFPPRVPAPATPAPGAAPSAPGAKGPAMLKPAPTDSIAQLNIPDSWKSAAADDAAYADYLEHHSVSVA